MSRENAAAPIRSPAGKLAAVRRRINLASPYVGRVRADRAPWDRGILPRDSRKAGCLRSQGEGRQNRHEPQPTPCAIARIRDGHPVKRTRPSGQLRLSFDLSASADKPDAVDQPGVARPRSRHARDHPRDGDDVPLPGRFGSGRQDAGRRPTS